MCHVNWVVVVVVERHTLLLSFKNLHQDGIRCPAIYIQRPHDKTRILPSLIFTTARKSRFAPVVHQAGQEGGRDWEFLYGQGQERMVPKPHDVW